MAHILVVDDESSMLRLLESMIEMAGHTAETASSAEDALHRLRKRRPHVLITDIFMPDKEGVSLVKEVREIDAVMGIIALTGGPKRPTGTSVMERLNPLEVASRAGADRTLWKPVDFEELLTAIEEALRMRDERSGDEIDDPARP